MNFIYSIFLLIFVFQKIVHAMDIVSLKDIEDESCKLALDIKDSKPYIALTNSIKKGNKAETQSLLNKISLEEDKTQSDVLGKCLIINYKNLDPLFISEVEKLGGNMNYQDSGGDNIFAYLAVNNNNPDPDIIKSLINCGSRPDITNKMGASALELAQLGNENLIKLLNTIKKNNPQVSYNQCKLISCIAAGLLMFYYLAFKALHNNS